MAGRNVEYPALDAPEPALRPYRDHDQLVRDEVCWREVPEPVEAHGSARVRMGRWRSFEDARQEVSVRTPDEAHVIEIALRRMDLRLEVDGRTVIDGLVTPGAINVTGPGTAVRCLFRSPFDTLHLTVPNGLIAKCGREGFSGEARLLSSGAGGTPDQIVHGLATALLGARQRGASGGTLYADSICLAIVARLLSANASRAATDRSRITPLPKWRLKRAMEYIEANLSEPVRLADMAASTGLTRMHFAAQFKAATGLSPHEYLLRRRVERAQERLARSLLPVVDIALQMGFQTQAHFTSVFKRFSGFPPHMWRQLHGQAA